MRQPFRVIHKFWSRPSLGTDRLPSRVRWVGVKPSETAIFYQRHRSTASDAEAAIAMNALDVSVISHAILLPSVYG
jgi:hypothetical protein